MKKIPLLIFILLASGAMAQIDSALVKIKKFQKDLNNEYRDPKTSPLKGKALKRFKKHEFFPVDLQYRVEATLAVTNESMFFPLKTSTQVFKEYRIYGLLTFKLKDKTFEVPVYQSKMLMTMEKYKNYLFFPFTDLSNGNLSYAAGRYIELSIPEQGNKVILDFNQAYNPYCAYSDGYSCPIVPADNHLDIEVLAGVKFIDKAKH